MAVLQPNVEQAAIFALSAEQRLGAIAVEAYTRQMYETALRAHEDRRGNASSGEAIDFC